MKAFSFKPLLAASAAVTAILWSTSASAVIIASDSASDASGVYDDGWQGGDNGGFGFGSWILLNSAPANYFITTSTVNGNGLDDGRLAAWLPMEISTHLTVPPIKTP